LQAIMSVWRIGKIDAQTRALAEAAAKAAGLPLGVWLERAVMQRVSGKLPGAGIAMPEAPPIAEDEISPEMRAALEAADRRRRARGGEDGADSPSGARHVEPTLGTTPKAAGDGDELPSDPFATPEPAPDDTPFEDAVAVGNAIESNAPLVLADETIATTATDATALRPNETEPGDIAGILAEDAAPTPILEGATAGRDESHGEGKITTTAREPLLPPRATAPRRSPSALPMLAAGLIVVLVGAGAGYYFLREPGQDGVASAARTESTEATTAASASTAGPSDRSAGIAPRPAAATPTPSSSAETSATSEKPAADARAAATDTASTPTTAAPAQSVAPAQPAASAQAAPPPPGTGGPSIANLIRPAPTGPSVAAATLAPQPPPAPPAATAPAAPGAPPTAVANEALPVLRGRAETGDIDAQVELGRRYVQGIGVGRNDAEAAKWLQRAADQGNAQAQFNVGVMYERGIGVGADLARALDYYRKSGAQNTPMAWHNLALLYASGAPGLNADPVQARKLMTQAAELGQIESQYSLALMHLQGIGGPADRVSAMGWMAVAARPNQPKLIDAAKQLSAQFNADERRRAQQLAGGHVQRISANLRRLQSGTASTSANAAAAAPEKPGVVDRAAIAEMQKLMISLDLYGGAADGLMGPRTSAAIREFQQMAGMPVDGKPSAALLESLREIAGMAKQ